MTESSLQNIIQYNFLSKENTAILYKNITMNNELSNLSKEQKDKIISILIDCMKQVYKTLDLTKINKTNMIMVKKQYNDIVIKKTSESIKNIKTNNENISNDRKNEREFNSIKRALPIPGSDRPTSSFANNHGPAPPGTTDYIRNTTTDLNTRLKELEDSRRVVDNRGVPDIPDFLKPVKVGKSSMDMPPSSSNSAPPIFNGFGGYNDMENNFVSSSDKTKYNETLSTQDRLKQIEMERNSITTTAPPPPPNNQALNVFNQPSMPSSFNNVPTSNFNNSQPSNFNTDLSNKINEMQMIINNLKQENEYLKNQKKTSFKSLQLEVAKKDASYNFQFNPISNIINIKLVAYSLPNPIYNIINDVSFNYKINGIEKSIIINPGFYYTIDSILNKLNGNDLIFKLDNTQKIIINSDNMFQIIPNYLSYKLGFTNTEYNITNNITAERIYDLRPPTKLYLFIKNIYPDQPVGILNFNGSSICELNFNQPINLNNLYLEFYTEDNILYNFNGITYNLSFVINIME